MAPPSLFLLFVKFAGSGSVPNGIRKFSRFSIPSEKKFANRCSDIQIYPKTIPKTSPNPLPIDPKSGLQTCQNSAMGNEGQHVQQHHHCFWRFFAAGSHHETMRGQSDETKHNNDINKNAVEQTARADRRASQKLEPLSMLNKVWS